MADEWVAGHRRITNRTTAISPDTSHCQEMIKKSAKHSENGNILNHSHFPTLIVSINSIVQNCIIWTLAIMCAQLNIVNQFSNGDRPCQGNARVGESRPILLFLPNELMIKLNKVRVPDRHLYWSNKIWLALQGHRTNIFDKAIEFTTLIDRMYWASAIY